MLNYATVNTDSYDISTRRISVVENEKRVKYVSAITEDIKERKADAIRNREVINRAVMTWMNSKKYSRVAYLMFGVNSGLRYGDIISLRVKDVSDEHGKIVDGFTLTEGKTGGKRSVYFNESMKKILEFIIDYKGLKNDDFIFTADGNRKAYFKNFVYDESGNIIDVETTGEPKDENGNNRKRCPIRNKTANDWYHELVKFGAEGHMTSHSARKTFRYFISKSGVYDSDEDIYLASQCLGHASVSTTMNYYCNITENTKKRAADSLNLGLETFLECLNYIL